MLEFLPKVPIIRPMGVPLQCVTERCSHIFTASVEGRFGAQHDAGSEVVEVGWGDKDRGESGILMKALSDAFLWREHPIHPIEPYKVLHSFRIVCCSTAAHRNERRERRVPITWRDGINGKHVGVAYL